MRSISWLFVLACAISSRVAFATDVVSVNIPFSFETHGKVFPASQYDVVLKTDRSFLTLVSKTNPSDTISFTPIRTDMGPQDKLLSIKFDQTGDMHELHTIRLGGYQTQVLDTHVGRSRHHEAAQSGQ
jgi:hypothetical protein